MYKLSNCIENELFVRHKFVSSFIAISSGMTCDIVKEAINSEFLNFFRWSTGVSELIAMASFKVTRRYVKAPESQQETHL